MQSIAAPGSLRATLARGRRPAEPRPLAMAAALALLAFGANMASPLYPGYQERLGFDDLTLTLIYAVYAAVSVPALLVLGPLGDRIGRVRMVRAGLAVAALGSVCFAIGDATAWLVVGRVLQGVALGAATGAGMAVLAGTPSRTRRRRVAAAGALAFLVGTAAGPGLTGLLADLVPAPYATPHLVHAGLVAAVYAWLGPVPGPAPGVVLRGRPTAVPQLPTRDRGPFLAAMANGFVSWAVVGLFLGLVPSVLTRASGDVGTTVLGAVAALVVLASLPAQALLARLGAGRAQLAGLALLGGGLVVLVTSGAVGPLPLVLATAVVAGLGHGLAYGGAHGVVETIAVGDRAAGLTATAYVVYYLGAGIPTIAVGVLATVVPLGVATGALAGLLLAATAAAWCLTRMVSTAGGRVHRRADADDSPLGDVAALITDVPRGIHLANGILHGRRAGTGAALRTLPKRSRNSAALARSGERPRVR
ncbi:MFS transporter [Pseudonocardia sp. C8]|uniref:MFS transporter n=1 Tax=Pseudonocardia sp. C8 TaxID=2762759 RepID=UPI00164304C6|nr:MFS transporter [Pseudonocardia sp. C8]MBC3194287.1 MFS transporter [Pseudonocardia sp. C8]